MDTNATTASITVTPASTHQLHRNNSRNANQCVRQLGCCFGNSESTASGRNRRSQFNMYWENLPPCCWPVEERAMHGIPILCKLPPLLQFSPTATTTYVVTVTNATGYLTQKVKSLQWIHFQWLPLQGDLTICIGEILLWLPVVVSSMFGILHQRKLRLLLQLQSTTTTTYSYCDQCQWLYRYRISKLFPFLPTISQWLFVKNVTVYLDATGAGFTCPAVNNGSSPGCDNLPISFAVSPNHFCNDINLSPLTVTLTVTSTNGTSATCTALVTVQDTLIQWLHVLPI